jgi:hypothetical protein
MNLKYWIWIMLRLKIIVYDTPRIFMHFCFWMETCAETEDKNGSKKFSAELRFCKIDPRWRGRRGRRRQTTEPTWQSPGTSLSGSANLRTKTMSSWRGRKLSEFAQFFAGIGVKHYLIKINWTLHQNTATKYITDKQRATKIITEKNIHRIPERCRIFVPVSKGNRGNKKIIKSLQCLLHPLGTIGQFFSHFFCRLLWKQPTNLLCKI